MFAFFKAKVWSGAGWLLTLCVTLVFVGAVYLLLHVCHKGSDHKKLDSIQLLNIDNVLNAYTDPDSTQLRSKDLAVKKTILAQRAERDQALFNFLRNEYNGRVQEPYLKRLDSLLINLNNKDTKAYLTNAVIMVNSFFWFVGSGTYAEVLFWALIGVLVSLIYYVSLANRQELKQTGNTDPETSDTVGTGPFDAAEISGQVSKIFYAPICALVLVLGYDLLGDSTSKMTDITIGKGLLLFSFISGFFSGRVIKFLDRLKDLVLPLGSTSDGSTTTPATNNSGVSATADINTELQLAPELSATPEGADIVDTGFNSAIVTLKTQAGDEITLAKPAEDQIAVFTATQIPFGKYTLQATMASKKGDSIINLTANKNIEVNGANKSFKLELDKTAEVG
jgi:hypothetical protein